MGRIESTFDMTPPRQHSSADHFGSVREHVRRSLATAQMHINVAKSTAQYAGLDSIDAESLERQCCLADVHLQQARKILGDGK
jgi:hypothetical protein